MPPMVMKVGTRAGVPAAAYGISKFLPVRTSVEPILPLVGLTLSTGSTVTAVVVAALLPEPSVAVMGIGIPVPNATMLMVPSAATAPEPPAPPGDARATELPGRNPPPTTVISPPWAAAIGLPATQL